MACGIAVQRAIDLENLPLAVVAAREAERFGGDPTEHFSAIAAAFCEDSPRRGDGAAPPLPLPPADDFHPLASVLTGALLLNKATEIVRGPPSISARVRYRLPKVYSCST